MLFQKVRFGERLRLIRKERGEAQGVLAELLGVSAAQISEMENGNKTTTVEKLSLICEHYRVSADYLLGLTDDPAPHGRKGPEENGPRR